MTRLAALAIGATLIAGSALAQATPPATPDNQAATSPARDGMRPGRGASIKIEGPDGGQVAIRCADGESTRACADVAIQLLERSRTASSPERRRDWDRDRDDRGGGESRGYRSGRDRDF